MQAVRIDEGGSLSVEKVPDPEPGPGEVVLRVRACGICGTDLHLRQNGLPAGTVLGHEFCGEVVEGASGLAAGVISCHSPLVNLIRGWEVGL